LQPAAGQQCQKRQTDQAARTAFHFTPRLVTHRRAALARPDPKAKERYGQHQKRAQQGQPARRDLGRSRIIRHLPGLQLCRAAIRTAAIRVENCKGKTAGQLMAVGA